MKAWVLHDIGDLRFEEIPEPVPKAGEVLVKVKCTGICSSDIPRIYGTGSYHYPIILGHEFSGLTEDGKRVGVFPLLPCFTCQSCRQGSYETCLDYSYFGSRCNGAFAEYVSVPEWNLFSIPKNMSFETAALLEPAAVAVHAVNRLNLNHVSSVAVIGDGIIGMLIVRWLVIRGVDDVTLYGRNQERGSCAGSTYDACFEAVGGSADALRRCADIVRPNGQIVLVGNPGVDFHMEQTLYWQLLRKQITVHGSWNSRYPADWEQVINSADALELDKLISHRYAFDELNDALVLMRDKREKHKKILITFTKN